MSRILESLRRAQNERSDRTPDPDPIEDRPAVQFEPEPGHFWVSLALLILVAALIAGFFVLLQYLLYGIEPAHWWDLLLQAVSIKS
ncbi:MAG: hypothetical protein WBM65_13895 [Sedimenticolaceae bacterium]